MTKILSSAALVSGMLLASVALGQAPRVEFPAPSPTATLKQRVGLTDIEIVYSRPGVKGRKIFGGLVPYREVWRTGANFATKIVFSTPVKLNGNAIPAGTNALFTIPGEKEWTIIINKGAAQWGSFQYNEKDDIVRFKVTPNSVPTSVETFTIEINDIRDDSATLQLVWDKTEVPIKLEVDLSSLKAQIDAVMSAEGGQKPYFQAATYYYDHGLDLKQASTWVDAAIKQREAHYIVHLKAKILAKLGDKAGAIAAAKRSTELAKEANDSGYVKLNEDLIASLK